MLSRAAFRGAWLAVLLCSSALANTITTNQTLSVSIGAVALISVNPVGLSTSGSTFSNNFTGSMLLSYKVRTSGSGGNIQVKAASDFTPAGGPSIVTPPTPGDALTYTCSSASLGTICSGTQTISTISATNVLTLPAGACTGAGCTGSSPQTETLTFTLINDPSYSTGTYQATLTFTASAV